MPRHSVTHDFTASLPRQWVYVNDALRPDVVCQRIMRQHGSAGCTASFLIPAAKYETDLSYLEDAEVVVYVESSSRAPLFRGFLDVETASVSGSWTGVNVTAMSPLFYLGRVIVGQEDGQNVISFPKYDLATGVATGWTLAGIAQWLFNGRHLSSNWRAVVGLGSIAGLRRASEEFPAQGLTFPAVSYRQAIMALAQSGGNVGVRESFTRSKTFVNFYVIGDGNEPERIIKGPTETVGVEDGAVIVETRADRDSRNIVTRVIGEGQPMKFMVTCRTQNSGGTETAPLEPQWDFTEYDDIDFEGAFSTAEEAAVLINPELARPQSPHFDAQYERVFRLFRLPDVLRRMTVLDRNIKQDSTGKEYEIQVFRTHTLDVNYAAPDPPEAGVDAEAGDRETTSYLMIRGAKLLPGGYIELPEAAVSPLRYIEASGGGVGVEYRREHVFVTITVADASGRRIRYDTADLGDAGGETDFPNISSEGLVEAFINEGLEYKQIATGDYPLTDSTGEAHDFGAIYHNEETDAWVSVASGSEVVVADHREFLASLCEQLKAERSRRITEATIRIPALYRVNVGDVFTIQDDKLDSKRLQAVAVEHVLGMDIQTIVVMTDAVSERVRTSAVPSGSGVRSTRRTGQPAPQAGAGMGGGQAPLSLDQFPIPMVAPTLPTKRGLMGPPVPGSREGMGGGAVPTMRRPMPMGG